MKVQNLMEEFVYSRVNAMYDKLKDNLPSWVSCTCDSCRLDVLTYVLNKVHPLYVVSGRGVIHSSQMLDEQVKADVDALVIEGIRIVSGNTRPDHKIIANNTSKADKLITPVFNFPLITGTVLSGSTFEPYEGASITLKDANGKVLMYDASWENPCRTYNSTKGTYTFWPSPVPAEREGLVKTFNFTLEVKADNCTTVTSVIEVPCISTLNTNAKLDSSLTMKVKDLYIFKV